MYARKPGKEQNVEQKYRQVIWFGRGGQGAITASQITAEAAHMDGYRGVTTAPSFGAERRGAPVAAFLKMSPEAVRSFSAISHPDVIVILDSTLVPVLNIEKRYNPGTTVVVNSRKRPEELNLSHFHRVAVADITSVALEEGLTFGGMTILNTPILGAFVRATEYVSLDSIAKAIDNRFPSGVAEMNFRTARRIFDRTEIHEH
jgi:2-oxoacid:acceptor oxidoreductase gamma subunit (pyruvate/2-ketoisovalerate family)